MTKAGAETVPAAPLPVAIIGLATAFMLVRATATAAPPPAMTAPLPPRPPSPVKMRSVSSAARNSGLRLAMTPAAARAMRADEAGTTKPLTKCTTVLTACIRPGADCWANEGATVTSHISPTSPMNHHSPMNCIGPASSIHPKRAAMETTRRQAY